MVLLIIEIVIFLATPAPSDLLGIDPAVELYVEECIDCHGDKIDQEVKHEAVENGCDVCHESTGEPHPEDGIAGFKLVDSSPDLCYYCHEEPETPASGHQPVTEGACLSCHDVHGSANQALILQPEEELCLSCHPVTRGQERVHSAIENGGCMICHQPHGSQFRVLLTERYPVEDYLLASIDSFGLCFMCHDTDLLEAEETQGATNFRDGSRNLHQLHINGQKGRNCKFCHNLHESDQQFLIEEAVPFGSWEMQMNFIATEEGGSCLPGCHGKKVYVRQ